jgi:membrane protein
MPTALPAGTGTVVPSWIAGLFVPTAMERGLRESGPLGPVLTFLFWLTAVFLVAVSGLALGQYVASTDWYRTAAVPRRARAEPC